MFGYEKDELWNTVIKTYPNVSQFWKYGKTEFLKQLSTAGNIHPASSANEKLTHAGALAEGSGSLLPSRDQERLRVAEEAEQRGGSPYSNCKACPRVLAASTPFVASVCGSSRETAKPSSARTERKDDALQRHHGHPACDIRPGAVVWSERHALAEPPADRARHGADVPDHEPFSEADGVRQRAAGHRGPAQDEVRDVAAAFLLPRPA